MPDGRGNSVPMPELLNVQSGLLRAPFDDSGPARYSEDIDLVQIRAEPIGATMNALREVLDPWLGKPQWKQNEGRVTFYYRFDSEDNPPIRLRLKVETNTREHFALLGYKKIRFKYRRAGSAVLRKLRLLRSMNCWRPNYALFISAGKVGTSSIWRRHWKTPLSNLTAC
jgi:hypothetical protein